MSTGRVVGRYLLARMLWGLIKITVKLIGRFFFGLPMDGKRRTDATFFQRGTQRVGPLPDYFGVREPSKWALLPGWQRGAIRVVSCGLLWAAYQHPQVTIFVAINAAAVVIGVAVWRVVQWARFRHHNRDVVEPLWSTLAPYLAAAEGPVAAELLEVPPDFQSNREARVVLTYPVGWDAHKTRQARIEALMERHIGTEWDVQWGRLEATWLRLPAPPPIVQWADLHPEDYPLSKVPMGMDTLGQPIVFDMAQESPHVLFTAPSGHGKSSTLRLPGTHTRMHGGLVDIIDFKLASFTESLEGVSGVRVHENMDAAVWALAEYYVSMKAAYTAIKAGLLKPEDIPPRVLLIDEFDTFMSMAADWWRAYCARRGVRAGEPPFLQAWKFVLWQGRAAEHRMVAGAHTPAANLFSKGGSGTAVKNNFVNRLLLGKVNDIKWRQTFDSEPRIPFDQRHPGRGVVNLGDGVQEMQVAWLPEDESRDRAMRAPEAPDWFDRGALPPWVTQHILDQAEYELRIDWLSLDGTAPTEGTSLPARMRVDVPSDVTPDVPSVEEVAGAWLAAPYAARMPALEPLPGAARTRTPGQGSDAAEDRMAAPEDELIVGEPAAVEYLTEQGFTVTRGSFKKARQRARSAGKPIADEGRTDDDRPCWRPADLLAWQQKRERRAVKTPMGRRP